jgi:magnesium transporter
LAAIMAVPTAATGSFCQNVAFPGEGSWSGFALSVLVVGTAVGLDALLRSRDWI